jgi:hypothetical protein
MTQMLEQAFAPLPEQVRRQSRDAYRLFAQNPQHPSLRFRHVHPTLPIYSARVNIEYRAVGVRDGDELVWFWIGSHVEYDQLLRRL